MSVPGKKLDIEVLVTSTNGDRKIMEYSMKDVVLEIKCSIRRKKLHRMSEGFDFLGCSYSKRETVRKILHFVIQIRKKR